MRPDRLNGISGYCSTLLTWRRTDTPTIDCPAWSSDTEVRAELMGEAHHNPATCGQCVCYNGRDGRQGSCTPVGERYADARACHRFFSTVELDKPLYGAKK